MPDAPAKPCVICGRDCSGQPRLKDAQGRYSHQSCAQRQQQSPGAKPKPSAKPVAKATATPKGERSPKAEATSKPKRSSAPTAAPAGGVMLELVNEALQSAPVLCENCGKTRPRNAILCLHCGFNSQTGKALKTRVERARKTKS